MNFRAKEKLVACPFNKSHMLAPDRVAQHLVKCRKNYPSLAKDMAICPFNSTHMVPKEMSQDHLVECPDRSYVERYWYRKKSTEDKMAANLKVKVERQQQQPYHVNAHLHQEDWDADAVESSYDPVEAMRHKNIPRNTPVGIGKASRKLWRTQEEERIRCMTSGEPIADQVVPLHAVAEGNTNAAFGATGGVVDTKDEPEGVCSSITSTIMRGDQPLRRPNVPSSRIAANIFSHELRRPGPVNIAGIEGTSVTVPAIGGRGRALAALGQGILI